MWIAWMGLALAGRPALPDEPEFEDARDGEELVERLRVRSLHRASAWSMAVFGGAVGVSIAAAPAFGTHTSGPGALLLGSAMGGSWVASTVLVGTSARRMNQYGLGVNGTPMAVQMVVGSGVMLLGGVTPLRSAGVGIGALVVVLAPITQLAVNTAALHRGMPRRPVRVAVMPSQGGGSLQLGAEF